MQRLFKLFYSMLTVIITGGDDVLVSGMPKYRSSLVTVVWLLDRS